MTLTTQNIFEPFTFTSGLTLKNRVLMAPMTTSSSDPNGDVTEDELIYYKRAPKVGWELSLQPVHMSNRSVSDFLIP